MRTLIVVVLALLGAALALAKPPPPGFGPPASAAAPWAAYAAKKPGPFFGRSLVGLSGAGAGGPDAALLPEDEAPLSAMGPMSPFLKLKPFLPAKPTFMPPVVDPSKFIDMKASLLNSLFPGGFPAPVAGPGGLSGAAPAAYSGLAARALLSPYAAPAAPAAPVAKPPAPAFLADLFKALNINKTVASATSDPAAAPAPAFPGAYSGAAFASPIVDPGVFISKKAKFLSDLFAGLSTTTTPAPEPAAPDTAVLDAEVAAALQKLLDALTTPQDASEDELAPAGKAKRAADTALLVADAKDKVVDTIIAQLAELKDGMVGAVSDLAAAQKAADAAAAAATPAPSKKPLSPYAAMWAKPTPGATAAPTRPPVAVEPVRQKVVLLGQVFDMLTEIEKNITDAMTVPAQPDEAPTEEVATAAPAPNLMDLVKAKIGQAIAQTNGSSVSAPLNSTAPVFTSAAKSLRLAGEAPAPTPGPIVDPTFWIPDSAVVGPDAYLAKTKAFLSTILAAKSTPSPIARRSYKPSYFIQQGQGQEQEQQGQRPPGPVLQQQQQAQPAQERGKLNTQSLPEAALLYQLRHHHHNRQPYWWN